MTSRLLRSSIHGLTPYISSETAESAQRSAGLSEVIKLSSNENPFGTSPRAIEAMTQALQRVHAYPDAHPVDLYERLAAHLNVQKDQILLGNGADNVLSVIGATFVNPGDEAVYCVPTFPTYRSITLLSGGVPVEVPLTPDGRFDLDEIQNRITPKTKLVFICNPNNPTGTIVDAEALRKFIEAVPKHVIVVLDEAYIEFVDSLGLTGVDFVRPGSSVIVVRTFSKMYGLAGIRIGYAIADTALLAPMHTVREPFAANRLAIAGALAALDDADFVNRVRAANRAGKAYLSQALTEIGVGVTPSQANFLLVDTYRDANEMCSEMRQRGILLRPGMSWGLPTSLRITIGTVAQMKRVVTELRSLLTA